jgi:hypothetical protein
VATNFCTVAPNFCTVAPNFCTVAPNFCTVATNFCTVATNFCTVATNFCKVATNFCTVAPNICGSSVWYSLYVTILEQFRTFFWKNLCAPALRFITVFTTARHLNMCFCTGRNAFSYSRLTAGASAKLYKLSSVK